MTQELGPTRDAVLETAVQRLDLSQKQAAEAYTLAKEHELDTARWREELRPRAMRLFAGRTAKLAWSRALMLSRAAVRKVPEAVSSATALSVSRIREEQPGQTIDASTAIVVLRRGRRPSRWRQSCRTSTLRRAATDCAFVNIGSAGRSPTLV